MDARWLRKPNRSAVLAFALLLFTAGSPAGAADAPSGGRAVVDLDTLVVSGAQPGPGLWTVYKEGHALHILGTVSPLPRRMEWAPDEVEAVIARSGVVIAPPSIVVGADVGFFRGMTLLPAALRSRNNPGKRPLREVVPPGSYARWEVLKARYLGRDRGVEKRRPLVAAQVLYEAALERAGLRDRGVVWPVVRKAAKAAGVPIVASRVDVTVPDPRSVLRELAENDLDDAACFDGTLDRIETDLPAMRVRANAWATGDIEALRALPFRDHRAACMDAVAGSALARRLGYDDLPARARGAWLANAEAALDEHGTSFSVVPMDQLLDEDGLLAALVARGYRVEAP